MAAIQFPFLYAADPTKGRPLGGGQIFIGIAGLDPEDGNGNPINSNQLNVVQDNGTVVPVSQPFILSFGGVPTYNGSTVRLDVSGNYSIKILDKNGGQTYYVENAFASTGEGGGDTGDYISRYGDTMSSPLAGPTATNGSHYTPLTQVSEAIDDRITSVPGFDPANFQDYGLVTAAVTDTNDYGSL